MILPLRGCSENALFFINTIFNQGLQSQVSRELYSECLDWQQCYTVSSQIRYSLFEQFRRLPSHSLFRHIPALQAQVESCLHHNLEQLSPKRVKIIFSDVSSFLGWIVRGGSSSISIPSINLITAFLEFREM